MNTATLAGGCFWCTEAIFKRLNGVHSVVAGYSGGTAKNPTYEQVCSGNTGHAEAIQIEFDPEQLAYKTLLDVFFHLHDPTTKNQQGADYGTQYRSVIFYHDEEQKTDAEQVIEEIERQNVYKNPIVTEVVPFTKFYAAEDYHKDYFARNSSAPYCQVVIDPKIRKLLEEYKPLLKK
jgi:peptide-methionine (S)-S-oxide reductase